MTMPTRPGEEWQLLFMAIVLLSPLLWFLSFHVRASLDVLKPPTRRLPEW